MLTGVKHKRLLKTVCIKFLTNVNFQNRICLEFETDQSIFELSYRFNLLYNIGLYYDWSRYCTR